MKFKSFLINEDHHYLGQRAGDILSAVQSLGEDATQMGNRALIRAAQGIVSQIRRVLHGRWDDDDVKYLKRMQKVGVGIMRAIDTKEDLSQIIASAGEEIQKMLDDLEVPVNSLGSEQEQPDAAQEPLPTGSQLGA